MRTISIADAETKLSQIIEQANIGEEIIITKTGKLIARLIPIIEPKTAHRVLGLGRGKLRTPENFNSLESETIQTLFESGDIT